MPLLSTSLTTLLLSLLASGFAFASQSYTFGEALARTARFEVGDDRGPLYALEKFVVVASANPAEARKVEQALLRALEGPSTLMGKDQICRRLSIIGTSASVPALARLLANPETADMARYALERIPGPEASSALRAGLASATGKARVGIINSLGARRDRAAVGALGKLLSSQDTETALAAAAALGRIGTASAAEALASAKPKAPEPLKLEIERAQLAAALQMAREGQLKAALALLEELARSPRPVIRIGALGGLAGVGGSHALPALERALEAPHPDVRAAAVRQLAAVPDARATQILRKALATRDEFTRVRVLTAFADRGDRSVLPNVVEATRDGSASVRTAALQALEKLGDRSVVLLLAEVAARGAAPPETEAAATGGFPEERGIKLGALTEEAAAHRSLVRLAGADIDAAILEALPAAPVPVQAVLLRVLGERGCTRATSVLAAYASHQDPVLRRSALLALRSVAGPADVAILTDLLTRAFSAAERREIGRALAAAVTRSPRLELDPIVSVLRSATSPEIKTELFFVLAQTGQPEALVPLREALKDSAPEVRRGAVLALAEWPEPSPLPDLLELARSDPSSAVQVLALQGFLRLAALPSSRTPQQTVALLAEALKLARRADEKRAALSLLTRMSVAEALELAESLLQDPDVGAEAASAAGSIRQRLKSQGN